MRLKHTYGLLSETPCQYCKNKIESLENIRGMGFALRVLSEVPLLLRCAVKLFRVLRVPVRFNISKRHRSVVEVIVVAGKIYTKISKGVTRYAFAPIKERGPIWL